MRCARPLAMLSALACLTPVMSHQAMAGEADVVGARAEQGRDGRWTLSATIRHDDEGWDHYVDRWEALTPEGVVIATRPLTHPHVNEQPFTRSLSGVGIDPAVTTLVFRAHDSVHGYGGGETRIDLSRR